MTMVSSYKNHIYQFKITLDEIEPKIWRRIQVPTTYTFWDLHVAIQDSMGWLDSHLHAFCFRPKHKSKPIEIGIPVEDFDEIQMLAGWDIPITRYLTDLGQIIEYKYDFGDSWMHEILFEGILIKEKGVKYPLCLAGERACPPEDCGSVPGYYNLLEILADPNDDEYEDTVTWLDGEVTRYHPFKPDKFDPKQVKFDKSGWRWKRAFMDD